MLAQPDKGTPSVNNNTDREIAPELTQFGRAFPRILRDIWETDHTKGFVQVSKLDVPGDYHRGTIWLYQAGTFVYLVS